MLSLEKTPRVGAEKMGTQGGTMEHCNPLSVCGESLVPEIRKAWAKITGKIRQ